MIYCLTGKIIKKTLDSVVISCGGVGYFVQIPATTGEALPPAGKEGTVYTIMNVTENDVSLYGFATEEQRDCFKMLTAVTGSPSFTRTQPMGTSPILAAFLACLMASFMYFSSSAFILAAFASSSNAF